MTQSQESKKVKQRAQVLELSDGILKMYLISRLRDIVQSIEKVGEQIGIQQMETEERAK